ncbi:MAG: phasin family protein [Xanthomonadales bacterium]|nr:phasin family protein [Xanthomonadales bacterium]
MKDRVTRTAESVNETARDIWLAGLGAFVRAQEEGGKIFDGLVKDGEKFEKKTRNEVNDRVVSFRKNIDQRIGGVRKETTGRWNKLESLFEDRVARTLARLGIPTADDIQSLAKRVESLSKDVQALNAKGTRKAA